MSGATRAGSVELSFHNSPEARKGLRLHRRLRSEFKMGVSSSAGTPTPDASDPATVNTTENSRTESRRHRASTHSTDAHSPFLGRRSSCCSHDALNLEKVESRPSSSCCSWSTQAWRIWRGQSISQRRYYVLVAILFFLTASVAYLRVVPHGPQHTASSHPRPPPIRSTIDFPQGQAKPANQGYTRTLVVGHLMKENITWLHSELPDLHKMIYTVDNISEALHTPINKGHEAFVYLHYIIYNYDNLPDTVLFFHAEKEAWHNNVLLNRNSVETIKRLNDARVAREGYVNTRCERKPGCPDWLHLDRPKSELDYKWKPEEQYFTSKVWKEVFPGEPVPYALSQPCCAQFAVSRDFIRARPQEQYIHFRDWLLQTKLSDRYAGRIFEYSWQFIFRGVPELCPSEWVCSCDLYGVCFKSEEDLEDWQAKRTKADNARFWEDTTQLTRELEERRAVAIQRGNDPRIRAEVAGRPWKPGDGF